MGNEQAPARTGPDPDFRQAATAGKRAGKPAGPTKASCWVARSLSARAQVPGWSLPALRRQGLPHACAPPAQAGECPESRPGLGLPGLTSEVPVYRCAADAERPGDLRGTLAAGPAHSGSGELARVHDGGPPARSAVPSRWLAGLTFTVELSYGAEKAVASRSSGWPSVAASPSCSPADCDRMCPAEPGRTAAQR